MKPVSGLAILSLNPSLQMKLTDGYTARNTDAHKGLVDERYVLLTEVTVPLSLPRDFQTNKKHSRNWINPFIT